jgi:hypothetical protein
MPKNYTFSNYTFLLLSMFVFAANITFAQAPKKSPSNQNGPAKGNTAKGSGKGTTKGTLAADMDCLVKINGSEKQVSVKAYTPLDVSINIGDNTIEATASDKKSTFRTSVKGKAGEATIIEISFFDDSKFLDYIKQGNVGMVETAVKKNPTLATNEGEILTTAPLEVAIENSQLEVVKFLMSKGASFTAPENLFPIHKSILFASSLKPAKDKPAPDRELVDFFLSKGCNITDKDDGGNSPLHCAVRAGKLDMVTFLISKKGADINAKNDFGDTPLKIAEDKGLISIMDYLKTKGALEK